MMTAPGSTDRIARVAGLVGLVGGLLGAAFAAAEIVTPTDVSLLGSIRNALFHLAAVVALLGLGALRATGDGRVGRIGIGVAIAGFVLLVVAELTDPFDAATAEVLFQICPLLIGVGMVVAGVAVLRARRFTGWRRVVPLVCGAYVFVVFLPLVITLGDRPGLWIALTGWELTFAALGAAVALEAARAGAARSARVV